MTQFKSLFIFIFLLVASFQLSAQAFIEEVSNFKVRDAIAFPKEKATLFVGSSSFRLWKDIETYFPDRDIINRGFGGSTLNDVISYKNEIIFPYNPSCIVIYCGENDIANDKNVDGKIVFERFKKLYSDIRSKFPEIPIFYISMKPSPSRWGLQEQYLEGNYLISKLLSENKNTYYIDVWSSMLKEDGMPNEKLFVEDMLHMNKAGYDIWGEIINSTFNLINKK